MYFNQNPNDNHDTQPNLNHSTYHYTGPELNGRERSGEPKPGFFQRRKDAGSKPPKQKKPSNGRFGAGSVVAIALAAALVGGGVGGVVSSGFSSSSGGSTSVAVSDRTDSGSGGTEVSTTKVKAGDAMTSSQIYSTYGKSVVSVNVKTSNGEGAGTGFFISDDGYILTCHHVIDGATAISVVTQDSTSYEAEVVGSDSDLDTAVLKVKNAGKTTFPAVVLGDSSSLTVGDSVTAIGNALGTLANTLTTGVVSAKDRAISMSDGTAMKLLQTDCTVNSGNSGGPLFNEYGQVIGIVSAKLSSSSNSEASVEGLGFAIPINDVKDMVTSIIEHGYVTGKPNVGILMKDVPQEAQQYGVPAGSEVLAVLDGSGAGKAGLQAGDIITAVNGTAVSGSEALKAAVQDCKAGDKVTFSVYRDGDTVELEITLDEDNQTTQEAMEQLQKDYQEQQAQQEQQQPQQEQQQPQQNGGYFPWPFGW